MTIVEENQTASPRDKPSPEPQPQPVSAKERSTNQPDTQQYGAQYTMSPNEMGPPSTSSERVEVGEHQVLVPKAGMAGRLLGHGGRVEGMSAYMRIVRRDASICLAKPRCPYDRPDLALLHPTFDRLASAALGGGVRHAKSPDLAIHHGRRGRHHPRMQPSHFVLLQAGKRVCGIITL